MDWKSLLIWLVLAGVGVYIGISGVKGLDNDVGQSSGIWEIIKILVCGFPGIIFAIVPVLEVARRRKGMKPLPQQMPFQAAKEIAPQGEKPPRVKRILSAMILISSILLAVGILIIFLIIFVLPSYGDTQNAQTFDQTIQSVVSVLVVYILPVAVLWLVSSQAMKIKNREEKGLPVSLQQKNVFRVLLQAVFLIFIGLPAILGAGHLMISVLRSLISVIGGTGDMTGGVQGIYRGIPFFIPDSLLCMFGGLMGIVLAIFFFIWLIIFIFRSILPTIRKDF